jgi:hypothetical protein
VPGKACSCWRRGSARPGTRTGGPVVELGDHCEGACRQWIAAVAAERCSALPRVDPPAGRSSARSIARSRESELSHRSEECPGRGAPAARSGAATRTEVADSGLSPGRRVAAKAYARAAHARRATMIALDVSDYIPCYRFSDGEQGPALVYRPAKGRPADELHVLALPGELALWLEEWISYTGRAIGEYSPLWPSRKPKPGLPVKRINASAFSRTISGHAAKDGTGSLPLLRRGADRYHGYNPHSYVRVRRPSSANSCWLGLRGRGWSFRRLRVSSGRTAVSASACGRRRPRPPRRMTSGSRRCSRASTSTHFGIRRARVWRWQEWIRAAAAERAGSLANARASRSVRSLTGGGYDARIRSRETRRARRGLRWPGVVRRSGLPVQAGGRRRLQLSARARVGRLR